ncbi:hypothetical protein CHUAL_008169 [Chamberlinius hualienensis]
MDIDVARKQLNGKCMVKVDDNIKEMRQLQTKIQVVVNNKKQEPTEQIAKFKLLVAHTKKQIYKTKLAIAIVRLDLQKSKGRTWISMVLSSVVQLKKITPIFSWVVRFWGKSEIQGAKKVIDVEQIESEVDEKKKQIDDIVEELRLQNFHVAFKRK